MFFRMVSTGLTTTALNAGDKTHTTETEIAAFTATAGWGFARAPLLHQYLQLFLWLLFLLCVNRALRQFQHTRLIIY